VTPDTLTVALVGLAVVLVAMTALWGVSLLLRDASIVDPFWGPGFALAAATYLVVDGRFTLRGLLVGACVAAWAARLGVHLLVRNRKEGVDRRYVAMAEPHGDRWWWVSLFQVFWLQAVLMWIVSAPLLGAIRSESAIGLLDVVGAFLFSLGLGIEAVADDQLVRFKRDPANRGRVLDTGLWRYSRHPNYFGDAVVWWGLYLLAAGGGAYWTIFGPLVMTFLLLRVSGVTLLERTITETRPGYAEYVARTSAFVPWPPRR
jgi:steroid 5-alpha reductase family enzyme